MADFDEFRTKYIYECPSCQAHIVAYRDCGKVSPCRCGGNLNLSEVIEPTKHVEYDGGNYTAVHTFKPYFDVTLGKEVTSKREITEYCKKNNCIYAGDKEISQQCAQNKRENLQKFNQEFKKNLTERLMSI